MDYEAGTNVDAMPEPDEANPAPAPIRPQDSRPASAFLIPNMASLLLGSWSSLDVLRRMGEYPILISLFSGRVMERTMMSVGVASNVLENWEGPPDSFVCQEMRTTGGRTAPKSQRRVGRRVGWLLQNEVSTKGHASIRMALTMIHVLQVGI
jgi:hypothetical protein